MGDAWRGKYVRIGAAFECLPFAHHWTKVSVRYSQYGFAGRLLKL